MNKTVLITGGTRGIGKSLVYTFAKNNYNVAFVYSSNSGLANEITSDLAAYPVKSYQCDLSDSDNIKLLMDKVYLDFETIDVLVNNAGITKDNLLLRLKDEDIYNVLNVNLIAAMTLTRAVLRKMMRQKSGVILNMSSVVSLIGNIGQSNYAASKAGINGFTKSISKEMAKYNIRANAIAPGFIETDMTANLNDEVIKRMLNNIPLNRFGKVEDVANLALFLSSDQANYITGQVISVDGGMV